MNYWWIQQIKWTSVRLCWVKKTNLKKDAEYIIPLMWQLWNNIITAMEKQISGCQKLGMGGYVRGRGCRGGHRGILWWSSGVSLTVRWLCKATHGMKQWRATKTHTVIHERMYYWWNRNKVYELCQYQYFSFVIVLQLCHTLTLVESEGG